MRIKPHCPEENGIIERSNRTVWEALEEAEPASRYEAEAALGRIIGWYNHERLHSSLGYLRRADYYRGAPQGLRTDFSIVKDAHQVVGVNGAGHPFALGSAL